MKSQKLKKVLQFLKLKRSDNDQAIIDYINNSSTNVRIVGRGTVIRDYSDISEETLEKHRQIAKDLVDGHQSYDHDGFPK
ncbi:hypothetical protein PBI_SCTP2_307 [Salicola phage SCTP-2]|nr:hypothetical protein PBI_SCTP2_307 [Salicola phage SCTP-2]